MLPACELTSAGVVAESVSTTGSLRVPSSASVTVLLVKMMVVLGGTPWKVYWEEEAEEVSLQLS